MKKIELTAQQKNKRLLIKLIVGVCCMFGFAYLLVPLYTLLCNEAGINGRAKNDPTQVPSGMHVDKTRTIKVEFSAVVHGSLAFIFKPLQHFVLIHPGETKLIYFYAQNQTHHGITVQAIPSITPDYAAKYLKKTQCFCFTQQYFFNNEKAEMPVYFYVDPNVPSDVQDMSLSYTLFDASHYLKKNQPHENDRIDL
ncbi:MAG: cytochrome c oxidase assembly protein [Legionellales bacterium]|nr:cytochrome c oxidase assembly protein [Legionellales bacterium]